jgi:hemerythrin-like metal-binding protein
LGDDEMDEQHKDLFVLANKLVDSGSKEELNGNIQSLYQHVKEHFAAEEALMQDIEFYGYKAHVKEHKAMLEKIDNMNANIWENSRFEKFMDHWAKHIVNFDMSFDRYLKKETVVD